MNHYSESYSRGYLPQVARQTITQPSSRRYVTGPPVPTTRLVPQSSIKTLATGIRDLEIHSSSTAAKPRYPSYTNYNGTSSGAVSDVPTTRKITPSSLPMLQPSYGISTNERPSHSDRTVTTKVTYADENSFEQKPGKRYMTAGFCGLRNVGNTCFMNSVLQCLSNTRPLLEYILNGDYRKDLNTTTSTCKGALISNFADLLTKMWDNMSTSVSPSAFKSAVQQFAPRFSGYNQQDSQEFLRYLLQGLQEDVNHVRQRVKVKPLDDKAIDQLPIDERADIYWKHYHKFEDSKIVDIFVGQLRSSLVCQVCRYESVAFDPFWDLSLPISKGYNTKVSLLDCIKNFMKEEVLEGQESARCDRCQKLQRCTKRFSIHRFPQILVLHLKRFSQGSYGSKLQTSVDFPVNGLNLSQFCDSPQISSQVPSYDLYAISNHSGTMYSGHYTAFAKHPYDSRWYEYSDSRVSTISSRALVTPEAYVLFYEQSSPLSY